MLKASAGMNYWEFVQFLCLIAKARLNKLEEALSQKSDILGYFNDLHTRTRTLLTQSPEAITFLKTSEDFDNIETLDKVESVIEKSALCREVSSSVNIPLSKLVDRLPKSLQDKLNDIIQSDSGTFSFAEVVLIVFRVYELHIINSSLQDVLNR